jgi:hypothetical protein
MYVTEYISGCVDVVAVIGTTLSVCVDDVELEDTREYYVQFSSSDGL